MQWKETFIFNGKAVYYNRIADNNLAERTIEVPIAFDFFTNIENKTKVLEVGNVLQNYENSLSDYVGLRPRKIVDKYEVATGVDNIDLMDLPEMVKYDVIISISTVEHVGQEKNQVTTDSENLEAPLKAIAKIYDLLNVGGKALITVPFGKILNGRWYIQFSQEYLNLLSTKYQIPDRAISKNFLKRIATELWVENPRHLWVQVEEEELRNVEYNWPWPFGNGIVALELTKISNSFNFNLNLFPEDLTYGTPLCDTISSDITEKLYAILPRLREINLIIFPDWSSSEDSLYKNLQPLIVSLLNHPYNNYVSLLIDTTDIEEEEANGILSAIIMNILSEETLDIADEPEIILLGELIPIQWQVILPRIQSRVILADENELAIKNAAAQTIPLSTADSLGSKRAIQLETGLWAFK